MGARSLTHTLLARAKSNTQSHHAAQGKPVLRLCVQACCVWSPTTCFSRVRHLDQQPRQRQHSRSMDPWGTRRALAELVPHSNNGHEGVCVTLP